ncbi:hypothetical protein ABI214_08140 [Prescottella soli]
MTALGGAAALSTTATMEPATRTGCTIDAINEPPGAKRDTLVKTSCGGVRSSNRSITDQLQVGGTYDFGVTERTTLWWTYTSIDTARPSR